LRAALARQALGELKAWDIGTGKELLSFKGHTGVITSVVFSPDGKRSAGVTIDEGRTGKVWDARTGQELLTLKDVNCVAFSPDGNRLAGAVKRDGMAAVKVWDTQTGQEILSFKEHLGFVYSVAFSPDGKHLASAGAVIEPLGSKGAGSSAARN
jgi:WD40 repeat protein